MSSTSPAVGRALDVLLYLAGRSGPVSGAAIMRDLEHSALVGLPPARGAHRARLRRTPAGPAHLRPRGVGVRGRFGLPAARAAGDVGPAGAEATRRPGARDCSPRDPARRGDAVPPREHPTAAHMAVTLTGIGVRMPAHLTASGRAMLAHLPAAQVRALFPSTRASSTEPEKAPPRCRSCGGCWQLSGSRAGRKRSGSSLQACSRWRHAPSTTPATRVRRSA